MTDILVIETNGTIKQTKVKDISFDILYKKAGFRVNTNFSKRTTWKTTVLQETAIIELWAKDEGKANFENKYDFPPPVDTALYFGSCILIRVDFEGKIISLTTDAWKVIYEKLFGGFEEIGDEDEFSEDELEKVDPKLKTKHGYLKDGFVVDEANSDEEEEDIYSDDENDEVASKKEEDAIGTDVDFDEEICGSELEEDEYSYSDDEVQ